MKVPISTGRVNYEPKFGYQDGVRIGSWYEETVKYIHEKHNHRSIYQNDFSSKKSNPEHKNDIWNNSVAGEGIDRAILMDHEGDLYYENYSATTDLSYNWLPKCKKPHKKYSTMRAVFLPQQDFALNYGNVTNFGLKEQKRVQWAYENLTGSTSWTTEFRDNFLEHEPESYKVKSIAIPRQLSSKIFPVNHDFADLWPRNRRLSIVPDFPLRVLKRPYPHFYF